MTSTLKNETADYDCAQHRIIAAERGVSSSWYYFYFHAIIFDSTLE